MDFSEIKDPKEIKKLKNEDLQFLCQEVRQKIISVCLKNGGHIGPSLGAVEIAVALHRVFDSPEEPILWDVGHQAYAHKLLTGRWDSFDTLRTSEGLSGFLNRKESKHDLFGAGHSSTAISAALGVSYRKKSWTVAVVGDGALTAGLSFEALLNCGNNDGNGPLLIVLNDNQFSISQNVNSMQKILADGNAETFFNLYGIQYVGPIDGNNLELLLGTLNGIKQSQSQSQRAVVLLHTITQKGKGYAPAEDRPTVFHGVSPASQPVTKTEPAAAITKKINWSKVVVNELVVHAKKNEKIIAITPAMTEGSELGEFQKEFSDRFFDVGIAEQHAVTFAGGLATQGWKPFVFIYSTFLQRAMDSLIHDVALQGLPVVFCVDRGGLVGQDGATHHGFFDLAFLSSIPGMKIFVPQTTEDLKKCMIEALSSSGPVVIRYPRGQCEERAPPQSTADKSRKTVISIGPIGNRIQKIIVENEISDIEHIPLVCVKPISYQSLKIRTKKVLIVEEGMEMGGIGQQMAYELKDKEVEVFGYPDRFVEHGLVSELEKQIGFDPHSLLRKLTS